METPCKTNLQGVSIYDNGAEPSMVTFTYLYPRCRSSSDTPSSKKTFTARAKT